MRFKTSGSPLPTAAIVSRSTSELDDDAPGCAPLTHVVNRLGQLVEGGNSAVLRRIELGERPVGVILLENILKVNKLGMSPARSILPEDGAVLIPSPVAILASTRNRGSAERFCRYMLSSEGQRAMVNGYMHPIVSGVPGPDGAPSFASQMGSM